MTTRTLAILLATLVGSGCILAEVTPLDAAFRVPAYGIGDSWHVHGAAVPDGGEARAVGVRVVTDPRGAPVNALEVAASGFLAGGNDTVARLAFPLDERAMRIVNLTPRAQSPYYEAIHLEDTSAIYLGMPFLHFLWAGDELRAGDASEARVGSAVVRSVVHEADATSARVRVTVAMEARHLDSVLRAWNESLDVTLRGDTVTYTAAGARDAVLAEFRVLSSGGDPIAWQPSTVRGPDARGQGPCAPLPADGVGGPDFTLAQADEAARKSDAFDAWRGGRIAFVESAEHMTGRVTAATDAAVGFPVWLLTYATAGEENRLTVRVQAARVGPQAQPFTLHAGTHEAEPAAPPSERPPRCLPIGALATAAAGIPLREAGWATFLVNAVPVEGVVPAGAPADAAHATAATWKVVVPAGQGLQRTLVLSAVTGERVSDAVQPAPSFG